VRRTASTREVNRIVNPDFSKGTHSPSGWKWSSAGGVHWERQPGSRANEDAGGQPAGVRLESDSRETAGQFQQETKCKPDTYYRIEATITCQLEAGDAPHLRSDELSGCALSVEPLELSRSGALRRTTPAVHRAREQLSSELIITHQWAFAGCALPSD
jgi:hypothetical protein